MVRLETHISTCPAFWVVGSGSGVFGVATNFMVISDAVVSKDFRISVAWLKAKQIPTCKQTKTSTLQSCPGSDSQVVCWGDPACGGDASSMEACPPDLIAGDAFGVLGFRDWCFRLEGLTSRSLELWVATGTYQWAWEVVVGQLGRSELSQHPNDKLLAACTMHCQKEGDPQQIGCRSLKGGTSVIVWMLPSSAPHQDCLFFDLPASHVDS